MKRFLESLVATPERRIFATLLLLGVILYIPLAGNYGGWDPWETHYGEVARQMRERGDYISTWWPGSPIDRAEFFSKPVLHFWLMALSMWAFGLEGAHPAADELTATWRVEWALRMPSILLSLAAIWSVWFFVRRLAGARAAALSALVLLTSTQWMLITRQAMTDMPFVAPMTIALALGGLALLLPDEERHAALPRQSVGRWSFPAHRAFYVFMLLFVLCTLSQIIVDAVQIKEIQLGVLFIGRHKFDFSSRHLPGFLLMVPYAVGFAVAMWWCARATNLRQLYLFSAYLLCAVASLAKGPAGIGIPAIVLFLYLVFAGRWKDVLFQLELPRGALLFVVTAFPWYHAMLVRHGMAFWNEFIGDNYVHRASGRNGDRGTFEYYLQYIEYGMFPWSGIVTVASIFSLRRLFAGHPQQGASAPPSAKPKESSPRRQLIGFSLIWAVVNFTVMSVVNTKFHHYILPALPALAILAGLFVDELLSAVGKSARIEALALLVFGVPLTLLSGRDLATFPARLLWMFNYDYVNMPGTGRPWPLPSLYGDRYEYGVQIAVFAVLAGLATFALAIFAWRRADLVESADEISPAPTPTVALTLGLVALFGVTLVAAIASGPSIVDGAAPTIGRWAWVKPTVMMLPFAVLFLVALFGGAAKRGLPLALGLLTLLSVAWGGFVLDKVLIELSPHWSQKHVIAAYYRNRRGPDEPLIAWQLYWRGENFYSRNEIFRNPNANDRTVFLMDRNVEKMQAYFASHSGRRVFFVVERARYESLRQLLPADARQSLSIVDESNNKVYLAVATLPQINVSGRAQTETLPK